MSVGDCSQQSHSHRGFAQDGLTRYNLCFLEEAPLISVADSTHTDVWSSATHTSLYSNFFFFARRTSSPAHHRTQFFFILNVSYL